MRKDQSYGAVVLQQNSEWVWHVLLVLHKSWDHWGLPKGHPEGDETMEETAMREVLEETWVIVDSFVSGVFFEERYQFMSSWWNEMVDKKVWYFLSLLPQGNVDKILVPHVQDKELAWAERMTLNDACERVTHRQNAKILWEVKEWLEKNESDL